LPADSAKELFKFKPTTDSASLLVKIEKIFRFGSGVLFGGRHKWGYFCIFWSILAGHRRQSNEPFFWLNIVLESRLSSASLEPLIDFLAYLEAKTMAQKANIGTNFYPQTLTRGILYPYHIWP